jgi:hypothetical protein
MKPTVDRYGVGYRDNQKKNRENEAMGDDIGLVALQRQIISANQDLD